MISRDLRFRAQIHGSPEMIFDLVADMPNYDRWLPDSSALGGLSMSHLILCVLVRRILMPGRF
jgi:ribosome-associated toxin RatA of RatAB toxin-antitoxin module